jgi:hypothetical protein
VVVCPYCEVEVEMLCAKCRRPKTGLRCGACGSYGFGICPRCEKTLFPR